MNSRLKSFENQSELLPSIDLVREPWRWRFVPKHLTAVHNVHTAENASLLQFKDVKDKDIMYKQSTIEIINKNKNYYLSPVRQIQKIMSHFNKKLYGNRSKLKQEGYSNQKPKKLRSKSICTTIPTQSQQPLFLRNADNQMLIEQKIFKLLSLPSVKHATSETNRLKLLSIRRNNTKQHQRQQILSKFSTYFQKQLDLINRKNTGYEYELQGNIQRKHRDRLHKACFGTERQRRTKTQIR